MRGKTLTLKRARAGRGQMSPPEVRLWVRLRERRPDHPNFRRQCPVEPYILDFYCAAAKLAVEVDGWMHGLEGRPEYDARRDARLRERGIETLRLAAGDVMEDPDAVAEAVWRLAIERAKAFAR